MSAARPQWQILSRRLARKLLPRRLLTMPGLRGLLGLRSGEVGIVDSLDGFWFEYSLDSVIGQVLYFTGEFEGAEIAFLRDRLKQAMNQVVVDVGANIGLISVELAALPSVAKVYAFEPARSTFALLERNIRRNGLAEKIAPSQIALGAFDGELTFHFCADDAYSSLVPDGRSPVTATYPVRACRLDTWATQTNLNHLDLLKIDVEGAEPEVIQGARETIRRLRPDIMIEIVQAGRAVGFAQRLVDDIRALGYDGFVMRDGRLQPLVAPSDDHINHFFIFRD